MRVRLSGGRAAGGPARKRELVDRVAGDLGRRPAEVSRVVDAFLRAVKDDVWERGKVDIAGFGVFEVREQKRRRVRAPPGAGAGEYVLPRRETVKFRASTKWRNG